jgi:hypothetical protein
MHKKLLAILILSVLVASILGGCGEGSSNGGGTNVPPTTPTSTLTMLSITAGNVFVKKAGTDNWILAQVGMSLEPGDTIKTDPTSNAEITFFDGSTIELQAGTQIEIVSLDISADTGSTTITLEQTIGTTLSRVTKLLDPGSSYEVETPTGVAAVRGSSMLVQVIADGITWVTNLEGAIWITYHGVELEVPQGGTCVFGNGGESAQLLPPLSGALSGGWPAGSPPLNFDIAITKMPDLTQAHEGDTVTYTYDVTNPGNEPLSDVSVTDDKIEDVTYESGDTNGDGRLDIHEAWVFTAMHTITTNDTSPLVNNAAAAGTNALSETIVTWTNASVDILRPAIAINKTAEPAQAHEGDTITYTYNMTNIGNTPLSNISVTDDKVGNITYEDGYLSGDTDGNEILDGNETWVFTATYNVTSDDVSPLVNTATVSGTDALSRSVDAIATASVTITHVNHPPVAINDTYITTLNTPVTIPVLDNDFDPDGDTLTVVSATNGTYGSVVYNASNVTYTPALSFTGADSFTYTISDGKGGTAAATVTVTVTGTLAQINAQIDTGAHASIYIWDNTTAGWAIDQDTGWSINGTNHATPASINVAGGDYYYVWVATGNTTYSPKNYPKDWIKTSAPVGASEAAYGYADVGILYPVHFTTKPG